LSVARLLTGPGVNARLDLAGAKPERTDEATFLGLRSLARAQARGAFLLKLP